MGKLSLKERLVCAALLLLMAPCAVVALLVSVFQVMFSGKARLLYVMSSMSRYINAAIFAGEDLESISGHSWRVKDKRVAAKILVHFLNLLESDHCELALEKDRRLLNINKGR